MADMTRLGSGIDLVARDNEMSALRDALRRAGDHHPGTLLLSGDAGVGKSRVLSELTRHARDTDCVVLSGRCLDAGDAALPYLPFVEIFRQLADREPRLLESYPQIERMLPGGESTAHPRDFGQLPLFEAVHAVLDSVSAGTTTVLAIEDLHWADRSSRDLLSFLLSRLTHQRLLVVGTIRSDDLHRRHPLRGLLSELVRLPTVERLHLDPLDNAATKTFVRALAGAHLPDPVIQAIAERSEGNAFLAEELASASGSDVPHELAEVLLSRMERLEERTQRLMSLAAVIGRRFSHDRLETAAGFDTDDLETALRDAIAHNVLVIDDVTGQYAFRHALLHEAVYHDLLPGQRSRHHARVAASLRLASGKGIAARLAHHSMESHDLPAALEASVRAAHEAADASAPAEVLVHTERALRLWDAVADPETVAGSTELTLTRWSTWAAEASGEHDRAIALSKAAIELSEREGDHWLAAELRREYAEYLMTLDGYEKRAEQAAAEAWQRLSDEDPVAVARTQATRARVALAVRHLDQAEELADAAVSLAESLSGTAATAALADAQITRTLARRRHSRLADVVAGFIHGTELAQRSQNHHAEVRGLHLWGIALMEDGDLVAALRQWDAGVARAAETGLTWSQYGLEMRVVQVLGRYLSGDWDGAAAAAELAGEAVSGVVTVRIAAAGLLVATGRGEVAAARRRLDLLRERWSIDQQVLTLMGLCGAELELHEADPQAAAECIERTVRRLRDMNPAHLAAVSLCAVGVTAYADIAQQARQHKDEAAATAAVEAGEALTATAEEVVRIGQPLSGEMGPEGQAWHRQVFAERTRLHGQSDPDSWQAVVDAFGYGEPYRVAIAQWRQAEALLAAGGDRAQAADLLRRADSTARDLRAAPLRAAIADLTQRSRLRASSGGTVLTARETAVLREVASGATNKQVGERLFISEKTVSVHLSRVMAKLGATSRTEAVNLGHTQGLLSDSD